MRQNLAIIYGSDSSEWEVSIRSGEFTAASFDRERYVVYEIFARFGKWELAAYDASEEELANGFPSRIVLPAAERPQVDKTDFSLMLGSRRVHFDYVYIMQHGTPGENGLLQGYLEMIGMPYSGCSSFTSAIVFDKYSCKNYLRDVPWVKCARDIFLRRGQNFNPDEWVARLGLPMFIKPTDGGSSFGVTKVKKVGDLKAAVEAAFAEGKTLIAEEAIDGREMTCAVYAGLDGVPVALPLIEIVPHREWFDYEAKYNGLSDEICPADVDKATWDNIQDASRRIYSQLGCEGLVRVDYILSEKGLYFLEINAVPGMTAASLVPRMVRTAGMQMKDFLNVVIDGKLGK